MDYIKLEMDEKGLELVFLYQNTFFFGGNFVCETYTFGRNNSE